MSINKYGLLICIGLLIEWLLCILLLGNNYKSLEFELLIIYAIVAITIVKMGGIYCETAIFIFTFGLFLCSYPFMDLFGINSFDIRANQSLHVNIVFPEENVSEALNVLMLTVIMILTAFVFCHGNSKTQAAVPEKENELPKYFDLCFKGAFVLTMIYRMAQIIIFIQSSGSYLSLFAENESSNPLDKFDIIVHLFEILFYIALAYKAEKLILKRYMIMYLISLLPQFALGRRGPVLTGILFLVWYYCNYVKRIKPLHIILPMFGLIFVANAVAEIRNNRTIAFDSSFVGVFLEAQGVTFDVVANASLRYSDLMASNTKHIPYFLGMVHIYFTHLFDRLLFRDSVFGHGQSMAALEESSYLGWKLTYLMAPRQYKIGRGTGSSFVAENFMFHKYFGCVVLTILMMGLVYWLKKKHENSDNIYVSVIFFIVVQGLFYTPRNNFWSFISDVVVAMVVLVFLNFLAPRMFKGTKMVFIHKWGTLQERNKK